MKVKEKLNELNEEVKIIIDPSFDVEVFKTTKVPYVDDEDLTFEDLTAKSKKAKVIETCVLFIDIRRSTELSATHKPITLTRLYSAFIRSMLKAGEYFDGRIRSIIGDRVLILFNEKDCFTNAINTAILLNTVSNYIIDKHFKKGKIKCGIGIDYGKMLAVKTGIIKKGKDNPEYKSLVWLGKTANFASKLTDLANKTVTAKNYTIKYKNTFIIPTIPPLRHSLNSMNIPNTKMITTEVEDTISNDLFHTQVKWSDNLKAKYKGNDIIDIKKNSKNIILPKILMTRTVYEGFKKSNPEDISIEKKWWNKIEFEVDNLEGDLYGGNVIYTAGKELK